MPRSNSFRRTPGCRAAGVKLAAALEAFGIDPAGRICLDVGASTGGFTHVLLTRGAAKVYAVDVGQGQLHASLRDDPRVANLERTDARTLTREIVTEPPTLIVCDASFIGAAKVLATPLSLAAAHADLITLIKPQFETGPGHRGLPSEDIARAAAQNAIAALDGLHGFRIVRVIDFPHPRRRRQSRTPRARAALTPPPRAGEVRSGATGRGQVRQTVAQRRPLSRFATVPPVNGGAV